MVRFKLPILAALRRLPFTREGLFWLLISLAMLVTGLLKGINLISLLACWLITLILWNYWLARRQLRRLDARRTVPSYALAQTPFHWFVDLANAGPKPAHSVTVTEEALPRDALPQAWFVSCAAAGQTVRLEGEASLPTRGAFLWNGVRLSCGYPFGLAHVVRRVGQQQELLVLPRLGLLQRGVLRHWLSQHCPTQGSVRAAARRQPTAQLEFHGLRTFRTGDSPRHIHWRTTARRGELMVREFEDLPNDNLILLVDPWTPAAAPPGTNADLERLLSLAATICWEWCRQKGDDFAMAVTGATPVVVQGITGRELAVNMLKELARIGWSERVVAGAAGSLAARRVARRGRAGAGATTEAPLDELMLCLRRPVAMVNVTAQEERPFFAEA